MKTTAPYYQIMPSASAMGHTMISLFDVLFCLFYGTPPRQNKFLTGRNVSEEQV